MIEHMSEDEIMEFNIPTGIPLEYKLDKHLNPSSRQFLGDPESVAAAAAEIAGQAKHNN